MSDTSGAALPFSDYIVFVDESGDHSLEVINADYPVFVPAFCIVPREAFIEQITPAVRRLKLELFGHDLVILHEHDIRKKTGPFAQLNKERRDALLDGLTQTIAAAPCTASFFCSSSSSRTGSRPSCVKRAVPRKTRRWSLRSGACATATTVRSAATRCAW
jgi:hypothetical protein